MARTRSVKPEFWTDRNMVQLSPFARLLYIGMWNFAICDKGHVEDDSFRLKLQILPMDDVDVDALLDELMSLDRIERINVDGGTYLWIRRLADHAGNQDRRWKTRCKACSPESSGSAPTANPGTPRENSSDHEETQQSLSEHMQGKERKGKEGIKRTSSPAPPATDRFPDFWASYPRKVGKQAAVKAYRRAVKTTPHERIMAAVDAYRVLVAGKDPQFTAHPATWLNAGRWDDEPDRPTLPGHGQVNAWANAPDVDAGILVGNLFPWERAE